MNPLYGMLNGQPEKGIEAGLDARMNGQPPVDMNAAMEQLRANPAGLLKQAGFSVPQELIGDSQKTVMHLIRSGQVGGPMMRMISPMLARLGVK